MDGWLKDIQNRENCYFSDIHIFIIGTKLDLLKENDEMTLLLQETDINTIIAKYHKTNIYETQNYNKMVAHTMFVEFAGYVSSKTNENVTQTIETCVLKAVESLKCDKCGDLPYNHHEITPRLWRNVTSN